MTLEENATAGGAGSAVLESLANAGLSVPVLLSGLPDRYIEHASPGRQWLDAGLDSVSMLDRVRQRLARCCSHIFPACYPSGCLGQTH